MDAASSVTASPVTRRTAPWQAARVRPTTPLTRQGKPLAPHQPSGEPHDPPQGHPDEPQLTDLDRYVRAIVADAAPLPPDVREAVQWLLIRPRQPSPEASRLGRKTVATGPRLVHFTGSESGYAGTSAREALVIVAPQFLRGRARSSTIREQYADRAGLDVTLYGLAESQEIHVIGQNRLADQMRDLLRENQIFGWRLRELPAEQTPVHALYALLSVRSANLLQRVPFLSVEEVAAVPDEALLEFRGLGPNALAEIRSALADPSLREITGILPPPASGPSSEGPDHGGDDFTARLRPEHRLRYQDFLRRLAAAGLPAEALDKILDSIGAEPVPPADPIVEDILQIANATDLLDYYTDTHEHVALDASGTPLRPPFLDR